MITQTASTWQTPIWQQELSTAITRIDDLLEMLNLQHTPLAAEVCKKQSFPLRVPVSFIQRMEKGNPDDPLLRQVLPLKIESLKTPGFSSDPLQEACYNPVPGIVHKYKGRVLLITSPACAIHCRYCFRRDFPYNENTPGKKKLLKSLDYIIEDTSITEVILSGGDPLAANDHHLRWVVEQLAAIKHIKRLRIHTRFPVVIPSRINTQCLEWMNSTRLKPVVVLHINHSNEIDHAVKEMVQTLRNNDLLVLNQSVLLKGINDSTATLEALQEKLFETGVLPYYLHLLDPVTGANHFDIDQKTALKLYRNLQAELPGYLLPKLVRDAPGYASKTLLC